MVCGVDKFNGQNHTEIDTIPYPQKCRKSAVSGRFFYFRHCGGIGRKVIQPKQIRFPVLLCNDNFLIVTE